MQIRHLRLLRPLHHCYCCLMCCLRMSLLRSPLRNSTQFRCRLFHNCHFPHLFSAAMYAENPVIWPVTVYLLMSLLTLSSSAHVPSHVVWPDAKLQFKQPKTVTSIGSSIAIPE